MNERASYMEQPGQVINTYHGKIKIAILGNSGCAACHNSLCMLGDSHAKEFEISADGNFFTVGEEVLIRINPSSGYAAVFWLYLLPFAFMMMVLLVTLQLGVMEVVAGLLSLLILVPYFLVLYLLRKKLATHCRISILKK